MELFNKEIENTVKNIFENNANGAISATKLERQKSLEDLSNRLLDFIPSVCWLTESNLAKALGTSERQIKYAKYYLCINNRITIKPQRNKNRANPRHYIHKNCDVQEKVISSEPKTTIKWEILTNFKPTDFREMTIEEQLDIYQEMNMPFIPIHFPKFKKDITYCSCSKGKNCTLIGKHPAVFFKHLDFSKKSTYNEIKNNWTEKDNRFNIGFLTNDFAVVDVDFRHGGEYSLTLIEEIYGEFPKNLKVRTGNGFHIYTTSILGSSVKSLGYQGIDVRSKGGYVVAPISQHRTGKYYEWESLSIPETLPNTFLDDIQKKRSKASVKINSNEDSKDRLVNTFSSNLVIHDGDRNDTLFRIASSERGRGKEHYEILQLIEKINAVNCQPPLSSDELKNIAESASSYTPNAHKELALKE